MPYKDPEERKRKLREKRQQNPEWRKYRNAYMSRWRFASHTRKREESAGRPRKLSCEICGGIGGGRSKSVQTVWDHDHTTGKFRGWLCSGCNSILGYAQDDAQRLRKLADYLDNGGFGPGPREVTGPPELVEQAIQSLEKQTQ